jgi:acyl-CoA synthetase (AMP-forming)/AMP-acid ligase II
MADIASANATAADGDSLNLIAPMLKHALDQPDAAALIQGDITVTYGEFADQVQRVSTRLFNMGITPGDRIILHLGNCLEAAIAFYAALMIGAIAVPLNTHLKPHEILKLLRRLQPAVYFGHFAQRKVMDEIPDAVVRIERRFHVDGSLHVQHAQCRDHSCHTWEELLADAPDVRQFLEPDPDATAVLVCTSGTTGEPKFVAYAQRSIKRIAEYMRAPDGNRSDRPLLPTPLFHMPGITRLCTSISTGVPIVLPLCTDFDAAAFLDAIERHHCTGVALSPFGAEKLIREQSTRRRMTDSLRACVVAGDTSSVELREHFERTFKRALINRLGMTEALGWTVPGSTMHKLRARPGTARLLDSGGNDVATGMPGELCLKGDTLFQGYWASPGVIDPTRDVDGWFHTGDLVKMDEHGDLVFLSRIKEIIVRDGENLAPAEIEQTLESHPAVAEAVVVGLPDGVLGEYIVGFVRLNKQLALDTKIEELIEWLATRLADHKVPETLLLIEEVPRTAFGKIDRRALRELACSELAMQPHRRR